MQLESCRLVNVCWGVGALLFAVGLLVHSAEAKMLQEANEDNCEGKFGIGINKGCHCVLSLSVTVTTKTEEMT